MGAGAAVSLGVGPVSAPVLRLVARGRPRPLSRAELQALTAERVAAWRVRREEEVAARTSGPAVRGSGEAATPPAGVHPAGYELHRIAVPLVVAAGPCLGLAWWLWAGASIEGRLLALAGAVLVGASAAIVGWIRLGDREDDGEVRRGWRR